MKKFKEWRGTALMKKLKRFFASILCICMIITSCPDLLAWAAGDTAVVKPVTYRLTANSLSKMVRKAELEKTEENGLCKLKLPKGFNKTLGKTKLHVYLQPDEDSLVFVFENKADKRQGAALIVDNKKSDIFAIPTKAEIYEELGYEYASDSNADEEEIDSEGLLGDDFQDLEAEIVDDAATGSDNNADEKYDYLEGYATHTILNNKKHTAGVAFTVSLDELGMDSLGELLPEEEDEDEIIATDSNAEETVPSVPEEIPTVTPPEVIEATPSDAIPVTVATPSNVAKTFIAEVGGVKIRAHAEAGVLPDEAIFEAIELKEAGDTADAYKEACETLDADEETEYDGVMAYDLHFLLHGEEVQPDGEVQITMEVSEKALPENVDPESLEVKHLDETSGTVEVVTVADTGDKADGTIAVSEAVMAASEESDVAERAAKTSNETAVTAEFNVDSFSYFMITYNTNKQQVNLLKVHLRYRRTVNGVEQEADIPGDQLFSLGSQDSANLAIGWNKNPRFNEWIGVKETADTFGEYTKNYLYESAYIQKNRTKTSINWIYCQADEDQYHYEQSGWYWYKVVDTWKNFKWYYSSAGVDSQPDLNATRDRNNEIGGQGSDLYLVYSQVESITSEIEDKIQSDGYLSYKLESSKDLTVQPTDDIKYEWDRSDDGGKTWSEVKKKKVTGSYYNVETSDDKKETHLYPSLDLSEDRDLRRCYKVKVLKYNAETKEYEQVHETNFYQVPYYSSLQNGSFEAPNVKHLNQQGFIDVPNGTTGLVWRTTGTDKQVELVRLDSNAHNVYYKIPDGNQFAELNAEAAGTLYQQVLTQPGTTLNWELYHRGREGSDTMYLIICPTNMIQTDNDDLTTQSGVKTFLGKYEKNSAEYEKNGYYVKAFSDDNKKDSQGNSIWGKHTSEDNECKPYTVPDGAYLTTFFFAAGATHTGDQTVGNLLDKVFFSTDMLPPETGYTNLKVTKIVQNIDENDLKDYRVDIKLEVQDTSQGSNREWTVVGDNSGKGVSTTLTFENGKSEASTEFKNLQVDNRDYRITEIPYFNNGTIDYDNYYSGPVSTFSLKKQGNTSQTGSSPKIITAEESCPLSMNEGESYEVVFTNTYTPKTVSLKVKKQVEGNMGNTAESFTFRATIKKGDAEITEDVVKDTTYQHKGATATVVSSGENVGTFELTDGEYVELDKIPYGAKVTIEETGRGTGYETTYVIDPDSQQKINKADDADPYYYTFDSITGAHEIVFINKRNIVIPTGLFDHGKPTGWWFLIIAAAGCLGFGVYRRKKKRDDGEECL